MLSGTSLSTYFTDLSGTAISGRYLAPGQILSGVYVSGLVIDVSGLKTIMFGNRTYGVVENSTVIYNHYVSLTDIPIAPDNLGVTGRKIYRRGGLEPVMRHVYTIGNNSSTTFIDNVPQQVLGAVLDESKYPPPNAKYIYAAANQQTYYLNIIENEVAYPSRVRFSQVYAPYYAPLDNVFDINPNDGSEITGAFEFSNLLHILKERSTWMVIIGGVLIMRRLSSDTLAVPAPACIKKVTPACSQSVLVNMAFGIV